VPSLAVAVRGISTGGGRPPWLRGLGATAGPAVPIFSRLKKPGVGPCCRPAWSNKPGVAAGGGAAASSVARTTWPALNPGVTSGKTVHAHRSVIGAMDKSLCFGYARPWHSSSAKILCDNVFVTNSTNPNLSHHLALLLEIQWKTA
jgi:hypothetical protein